MKKFFSVISLQDGKDLKSGRYEAMGNTRLQMERETCFPIIAAMNGYLEAGEEFSAVVVVQDNRSSRENLTRFKAEVAAVCEHRGAVCRQIREVWIGDDQSVGAQVGTFQTLLDCVEDDDELFFCMTYGTKPLSAAVMMAVQYAYRVKKNTTIECIVYGEYLWRSNESRIYDMTALVQMDEIVRMLADRGVTDPKSAIDRILSL